jgi:serine/threonine protein kinase
MNKLKKASKEKVNESSTYLCTFERIVCVAKVWPPTMSQQDQMHANLQIFTIKSLCECDHVVRYIYSDTDKNGNKCLFMEHMNQGTVGNLINTKSASKSTFSGKQVLHYTLPIASALAFMHKCSPVIAHQDIQADNVFLTNKDSIKHIVKLGGFSAMQTLRMIVFLLPFAYSFSSN